MTSEERYQAFRRRLHQARQQLRWSSMVRAGAKILLDLSKRLRRAPRLSVPPFPLDGRFSYYGPLDALDSDDIDAMGGKP